MLQEVWGQIINAISRQIKHFIFKVYVKESIYILGLDKSQNNLQNKIYLNL